MLPPVHNVRFSSKIQVVSQAEFDRFNEPELRRAGLSVDYPWDYKQRVPHATEAITSDAQNCNAGGITNGLHLALFHINSIFSKWNPQPQHRDKNYTETMEALDDDISRLKKENPNLRALLTGGDRNNYNSPDLKAFLLGIFKYWSIPVSILWGQREDIYPGSSVHYTCANDTWSLCHCSGLQTASSLDDLKKAYEHIHIDPGDQLVIAGQEIPRALAEQELNKP